MQVFIRRLNNIRASVVKHNVSAYAAQTAFFILLSFFPFIMLIISLIKHLPFSREEFLRLFLTLAPNSLAEGITEIVSQIYGRNFGLIPITAIAALWSASKGVYSLMRGLDTVYGTMQEKTYLKRRLYAVFYTMIFITALIFTVGIVLFGEWLIISVAGKFNYPLLITVFRMFTQAAVLSILFTVIYYCFTSRKIKFKFHLPGGILSSCGWVIFTEIYSLYFSFANTDIYGSMATVIFTMLWLYICMYILMIGGEINMFLFKLDNSQR